jgi:hypothetical protein
MISSQQRLVLFSTPYRSQRLYLRIASAAHYSNGSTASSSSSDTNSNSNSGGTRDLSSAAPVSAGALRRDKAGRMRRRVLSSLEVGDGALFRAKWAQTELFGSDQAGVTDTLLQADLLRGNQMLQNVARSFLQHSGHSPFPTQPETRHGRRATALPAANSSLPAQQLMQGLLSALGIESVAAAQPREVMLTPLTPDGYLSVMLTDQPLQQKGANSTASNGTPSNATVGQLPSGSNSTGNAGEDGSSTGSAPRQQSGDFLLSIAVGEALLPARFKSMQSAALPPSLVVTPSNRSSAGGASRSGVLQGGCLYTAQLKSTSRSSAAPTDPARISLPADIKPEPPSSGSDALDPPTTLPKPTKSVKFEPVQEVRLHYSCECEV